jgi:hypothetical protein
MSKDKARLSGSPRSHRSSTNDPEKYAKGEVRTGFKLPSKHDGVNEKA